VGGADVKNLWEVNKLRNVLGGLRFVTKSYTAKGICRVCFTLIILNVWKDTIWIQLFSWSRRYYYKFSRYSWVQIPPKKFVLVYRSSFFLFQIYLTNYKELSKEIPNSNHFKGLIQKQQIEQIFCKLIAFCTFKFLFQFGRVRRFYNLNLI
jgi:hypothetical protein